MAFDYASLQGEITEVISEFGFTIQLAKLDGRKAKASAVWAKQVKLEQPQSVTASRTYTNTRSLFIAGNIKLAPEAGDYVMQGSTQLIIESVEAYSPASLVIAYYCEVST